MKKIAFIFVAFLSTHSAFGADVCQNHDGSIIYDSATTFGNSIVIVNPRLKVAGAEALVKAEGDYAKGYYGSAFCKALGMKDGLVTDTVQRPANSMIVEFTEEGVIKGVGQGQGYSAIKTVTCQK